MFAIDWIKRNKWKILGSSVVATTTWYYYKDEIKMALNMLHLLESGESNAGQYSDASNKPDLSEIEKQTFQQLIEGSSQTALEVFKIFKACSDEFFIERIQTVKAKLAAGDFKSEAEKIDAFKDLQDLEISRFLAILALNISLFSFITTAVLKSARLFKKEELKSLLATLQDRSKASAWIPVYFEKVVSLTKTRTPSPQSESLSVEDMEELFHSILMNSMMYIYRFPLDYLIDSADALLNLELLKLIGSPTWKEQMTLEFTESGSRAIKKMTEGMPEGAFARVIPKAAQAAEKLGEESLEICNTAFYMEIYSPVHSRDFEFKEDEIFQMIQRVVRGQ
jgi:hypothetical protein